MGWFIGIGIGIGIEIARIDDEVDSDSDSDSDFDALHEVARELNATPGQVALAWQIARPSITAPIASASTLQQLNELAQAAQLKLDAATIAKLDAASAERGATPSAKA